MSFSLTFSGHAGPGMDGNSPEEIAAVQAVVQATRSAFAEQGLNLGMVQCSPPDWLTPDLATPAFVAAPSV